MGVSQVGEASYDEHLGTAVIMQITIIKLEVVAHPTPANSTNFLKYAS